MRTDAQRRELSYVGEKRFKGMGNDATGMNNYGALCSSSVIFAERYMIFVLIGAIIALCHFFAICSFSQNDPRQRIGDGSVLPFKYVLCRHHYFASAVVSVIKVYGLIDTKDKLNLSRSCRLNSSSKST